MPWNPFDWPAGPFLTLYLALAAVLFLLGFRFKSLIGPAAAPRQQLSVLELACLADGERRLGDTVLLGLASGNGATITPKGSKITVTSQAPLAALMDRPPALPVRPEMTRRQFQTAVKPVFERVVSRLQAFGYYPTDEQMTTFRMSVLPFVALLLGFGFLKVLAGTERHHPVGFLIILLVLTAFAGVALVAKRPTRTRAGNDALQRYRASQARAARAPLDHELLLAVALSGAVVLSGTAYASVYAVSSTMNNGSSGGGCGSGGCGGGGGGGCGGCS